jgi:hypothetical protein
MNIQNIFLIYLLFYILDKLADLNILYQRVKNYFQPQKNRK